MTGQEDALDAARARIAVLEAEVARLHLRAADTQALDALRVRLARVGVLGVISAPSGHDELLEQVVLTAMRVLRAHAGTLYLLDEGTDELIFEIALGEQATPLRHRRMPSGQGIAGWVASTGQAIAIADAQQDERWAQEIANMVGYRPRTMLVVPLQLHDDVIGVLQLLDKEGNTTFDATDKEGNTTFDATDMETLGLFAQQAAVMISQSARARSLSALLHDSLTDIGGGDVVARMEESAEYREVVQIATVVGGLIRQGEAARRLCREIVGALDTYLHGGDPSRQW